MGVSRTSISPRRRTGTTAPTPSSTTRSEEEKRTGGGSRKKKEEQEDEAEEASLILPLPEESSHGILMDLGEDRRRSVGDMREPGRDDGASKAQRSRDAF